MFVICPVEGEDESQNPSDSECIILLLTLFYDWFQHLTAHSGTAAVFYQHLKLNSVLFKEQQANQSVQMVFWHVLLKSCKLFIDLLEVELFNIPKLGNDSHDVHERWKHGLKSKRSGSFLFSQVWDQIGGVLNFDGFDPLFEIIRPIMFLNWLWKRLLFLFWLLLFLVSILICLLDFRLICFSIGFPFIAHFKAAPLVWLLSSLLFNTFDAFLFLLGLSLVEFLPDARHNFS